MEVGSTKLVYKSSIATLGSADGTVRFANPLIFSKTCRFTLRLVQASFSSEIPNVYSYNGIDNSTLKISLNASAGTPTWTKYTLDTGVYNLTRLEYEINGFISDSLTTPGEHAILLYPNAASGIVNIELDSSKLAATGAQIGLDLSCSLVYDLFGFAVGACKFVADGTYTATNFAKLNWFGDGVTINLSGFGSIANVNGSPTNELCTVPLSTAVVTNEYIYPSSGIVLPTIPLTSSIDRLSEYSISFVGSRDQAAILFMEGSVYVEMELRWSR